MGEKQVLDLRLLLPAGAVIVAGWGFSLLTIWQFMVLLWLILLINIFLLVAIVLKIRNPRHLKAGTSRLLLILLVALIVFALQIIITLQLKINTADPLIKYMAAGELRIQVQGYVNSTPQVYAQGGLARNGKNTVSQWQGQKENCRWGKITLEIVKFRAFANSSDWLPSSQQIQVQNLCIEGVHRGQLVEMKIRLYKLKNNLSNNAFADVILVRQLRVAELQSGMKAVALGNAKILAEPTGIAAINQNLGRQLATISGGEISRQLLPALLLGDRSQLQAELIAAFNAAGLLHIVCLSGMHLNIIVAILQVTTAWMTKKFQFFMQLLAVLGFCWLVGGGSSVIRAAFMAIIVFNSELFGGGQSLNSLFLVVISMVLITPNNAYNLGFLYSVLATFGILLGSSKVVYISSLCAGKITILAAWLRGKTKRKREVASRGIPKIAYITGKAMEIMGISLLANLFILPLSSFYQGSVNPLVPLSNLLVLPLLPVVIMSGIVLLLLLLILPVRFIPLTEPLASIIELICGFIWQVAQALG